MNLDQTPVFSPDQAPQQSETKKSFEGIKGIFLKILIGCLIAAAALAVTTVLMGSFNETFGRAISTIMMIAVHALASFWYIGYQEKKTRRNLVIFNNVTFTVIVLSFFTSVLGVWQALDLTLVFKLYLTYFVLLFATLHGEALAQMIGKVRNITSIIYLNFVCMLAVVLMLLPVIFIDDKASLGNFYYRGLSAIGIIDVTLTILAIILFKLYLQKHPEEADIFGTRPDANNRPHSHAHNVLLALLVLYLVFQALALLYSTYWG